MYIEQIYTDCLAEASYYIESEGEAIVIDPMREPGPYLEKAKERNASIKYVFETHFHADFVSGHIDLARASGATIVYGPTAKTGFDALIAEDNQEFKLGNVKLKVLHTPGHTMESSCFLLIDENGKDHAVFTGDTLFIGDVGRPDLAVKSDLTQEDLAGMLYDSLHNKLMPLADDVILYPGHGAGSSCGKNLSSETVCSIGEQRKSNYALKADTKEAFVAEVTDGIKPPPQYFPKDAMINKNGYESLDVVMEKGTKKLSIEEFKSVISNDDVLLIDTRAPQTFCKGFVPGAINFGLSGSFAVWIGTLISDVKQKIVLVNAENTDEEAIIRLARVGYDNVIGTLDGGFEAWKVAEESVDTIDSINADTFKPIYENELDGIVLDVRADNEYEAEKLESAENYSLRYLEEEYNKLDKTAKYYIHCRSGYRSMIAASLLKKVGFSNLVEIAGGAVGLKNAEFKMVETV